ncbi:methyltransferase domain-containing protein [Paenibacillus hemerocallicola]|uniref:Methyltransferase domain-containing protein n=1 Tax=Paenibacillus hemerocallicola TaxID=1172614 RepID=A0A5C4TG52_9BACL|nr:methyltransferase domain-containing protein [Paenibacillus hemerocallicola]TNJ67772.1 methyltransferase domain-containing protein [Paenibacillus hemerocallicola]
MAHLFATVLPGLEYVLENEIRVKITDAKIENIERGKVFFTSDLPADALMVLRTADNLYESIHRFRVGPHKIHLIGIEKEISQLDLSCSSRNRSEPVSFNVNASRKGKHTYSRFEAAEAAARGIAKRNAFCRHEIAGTHDIEFRLDIDHEEAMFALRLTDAAFRYRKNARSFTNAALRPTIAHALVWLSSPEPTDVFVDPCCGSGTIVSERIAYAYSRICGGDLSKEAVAASLENVGIRDHVKIRHWDARRLPIEAGTVNKMVTNLPFGRQISSDELIPSLYQAVFKEMRRVLDKNGFVLCMTDADAALQTAARQVDFSCRKEAALSLKGLHPAIYRLEKQ